MDEPIFYVYSYLREDGTPYYIGKGKGKRATSPHSGHRPPNDQNRIKFLVENLTEDEAFMWEKHYIAQYGRQDIGTGILRNKTDGGEGPSGHRRTRESIARSAAGHLGKKRSPETRSKIAKAATGRKISNETRKKMSMAKLWIPISPETVAKIAKSNTGKKRSPEVVAEMTRLRRLEAQQRNEHRP